MVLHIQDIYFMHCQQYRCSVKHLFYGVLGLVESCMNLLILGQQESLKASMISLYLTWNKLLSRQAI